jgi:putrescine transport system substrate-binding protein
MLGSEPPQGWQKTASEGEHMKPMHVAAAAALAGILSACGEPTSTDGTAPPAENRVVNVYNWPDYIAPELLDQFEAETGIRVNYSTFESNEMLETKLLTGNAGYDVVVATANFLPRQVAAGVYQPIDHARLRHYGNLDPDMMAMLAENDPGNRHAVGYMWGTTGIGYDARKVAAAMPDAPTDSWRLVFDPAVASKLAGCGIAFVDAPSEILAVTLLYLGKDPYSAEPGDLAAAEAALLAIRPYVRYISNPQLIEDLAGGNICMMVGWSGDVLRARLRSAEAKLDTDIRYTIPTEGTLSWMDSLAIPRDAPHPDAAHAFIDFLLRADVGAANAAEVRFATFNRAALPLLDEALTSDPTIYPAAEVRARLHLTQPRNLEQTRIENRLWTRFRTGQ